VDFTRSKQRKAERRAKRAKIAESSRQTASKNPVEIVLRVKHLTREVGGIKNLKMLVDLLAE
jgi:ribosomal protein S2